MPHGSNIVFTASDFEGTPTPQPVEILECGWYSPQEIAAMLDENVSSPLRFRMIMADLQAGVRYPLNVIREASHL